MLSLQHWKGPQPQGKDKYILERPGNSTPQEQEGRRRHSVHGKQADEYSRQALHLSKSHHS